MSDAVKNLRCLSCVRAKSGLPLSKSMWGKKRMVTVEILVIVFKLTSREGTKEKNMLVPHLVISCCLT